MVLATRLAVRSASFCLGLAAGLLVLPPALAQPVPSGPDAERADTVIGEVITALEVGDTETLLDHASRRVEIILLGQSALYSRGQAALVLRDFFRRHPADRVQLSERAVGDEGRAAMGRYWSENGSGPYALYVGFRADSGGQLLLDVIRIERATFHRAGTR